MKIYIVVGSVREGRTAIKVAHWVLQEIKSYQDLRTIIYRFSVVADDFYRE